MNLEELNKTELIELIYRRFGKRVNEERELLLDILNGELPIENVPQRTIDSRRKLQVFIEQNYEAVQTNLPCRAEFNAGKCTIFPCSDVMHKNCYNGAKEHIERT